MSAPGRKSRSFPEWAKLPSRRGHAREIHAMPHALFLRMTTAGLALLASGCATFRGSPDDYTDDAMEMQPNPRRTETPSLLGPGSERVTTGTLPVIRFAPESWRIMPSEESKILTVAQWFTGHPERV